MSTTEQRRAEEAKAKESARIHALALSSRFLTEWRRVSSILNLLGDGAMTYVTAAKEDENREKGLVWLPETMVVNTDFLCDQLEDTAGKLWKALEEAGFHPGELI